MKRFKIQNSKLKHLNPASSLLDRAESRSMFGERKLSSHLALLLIGILSSVSSFSQQLPHFSQYVLNDYAMNPAIAGKNNYFLGMSDNRYQWGGITDAPRTYVLSVHGPLKWDHMGVGGQLFTDIVGPTRRTGLYATYAYHAPLNDKMKLSFGLNAGILQFTVDGQKITTHDPGDLILTNSVQSALMPDFGFGFMLYSDRWWAGVSCLQIAQNRIKFFDYMTSTTSVLARTFYGQFGYQQPIGDDFILEGSACLKYVHPAPFQFDLGLRGIYQQKFWIGGSFRNLDAITMNVGVAMRENLILGYSYDYTLSNLGDYSNGTHELLIGIKFNKKGMMKSDGTTPEFN